MKHAEKMTKNKQEARGHHNPLPRRLDRNKQKACIGLHPLGDVSVKYERSPKDGTVTQLVLKLIWLSNVGRKYVIKKNHTATVGDGCAQYERNPS